MTSFIYLAKAPKSNTNHEGIGQWNQSGLAEVYIYINSPDHQNLKEFG
jgi:hypothetical protein